MKINRQRHRPLEVSIGGLANRDPMFVGYWYGPDETLPDGTLPGNVPEPRELLLPLPAAMTTGLEERWKLALEKANEVTDYMTEHEPSHERHEVFMAVSDVIHTDFTPADVLAAYRKRMTEKRNG